MLAGNSRAIYEGNRQDQMMGCAADYLGAKFVRSKTCWRSAVAGEVSLCPSTL